MYIFAQHRHLYRVVREYVDYFNGTRLHQGIGQRMPGEPELYAGEGEIIAFPVLGGLHHDYYRSA